MTSQLTGKEAWTEPKVMVYGNVQALTLKGEKNFGVGDSFTFENITTVVSG
jgi:hypothetical protein